MENVIKCQICSSDYNTKESAPMILRCGHTLCQSCLILQLQKKECPFCRDQFLSANLNDYKKNFAIMSIVDTQSTPEISNMKCSEDYSEAQHICLDCKSYVCDTCILHVHFDHNVKKLGDVFKEVNKKISHRRKVADLCEERQIFYEKTLNFMIQSLKNQVNTEFSRIIKTLTDRQAKLLDELNEIMSKCNKYTLEKSEIEILKTKEEVIGRLLKLDDEHFKQWDHKTSSYIRGNNFYQNFKEFAHTKFVCSDFMDLSQLESSIFFDTSQNCIIEECKDYCGKLEEFTNIHPGSSDFSIYDLEIFESQFFYQKAIIDRYEKNGELENYYKDNIEKIKKANTSPETLKKIANYFKEKSIATRKRDKKTAYSANVNQKNLEIITSENNSYLLFILAYLSIPTVRKFLLKNCTGNTDETLLLAKKILRKMHSENSQKITCDDIKRLLIPFTISIPKKNEVMIFMLKSFANLRKKIQKSKIKMNLKYKIPELFKFNCTLCSSMALEEISILEKKIPNFTKVIFSSKTLQKKFIFFLQFPWNTKEIKTKILSICPSIDLESLVIMKSDNSVVEDPILFNQTFVYALEISPSPISKTFTKIIPVYQGKSEDQKHLIYFMRVTKFQDEESLTQELIKFVKFPLESKYFHSITMKGNKVSYIGEDAYIRFDLGPMIPILSFEEKYLNISFGVETLYAKCTNCSKNTFEIADYPHTFMVHMKFASFNASFEFRLGESYSTRIPHKLIAVLAISYSKNPTYSIYFIGADRKGYTMGANYCKEIKLSDRIEKEPIIMIYSIYD